MSDKTTRVKLTAPVIVQGRQRNPGDEIEVSEDDAQRYRAKGWVSDVTKHRSHKASGGPKPKTEAKASDTKGDDTGSKGKPSSSSKTKSDKD